MPLAAILDVVLSCCGRTPQRNTEKLEVGQEEKNTPKLKTTDYYEVT